MDVSSAATAFTAAGAVEIGIEPIPAPALNIAFALNRSGSTGKAQWAEIVEAVREAVIALRSMLAPSSASVEVKLITFATDVSTSAVFDL